MYIYYAQAKKKNTTSQGGGDILIEIQVTDSQNFF